MIKKLKKFTIQMMMGANVFTILLMLFTGYSDHLHPEQHPLLSTTGMAFPLFLLPVSFSRTYLYVFTYHTILRKRFPKEPSNWCRTMFADTLIIISMAMKE